MTEANQTLLDRILTEAKLSNHDVVAASEGKLNHKNIQKARVGNRPVTDRVARSLTDIQSWSDGISAGAGESFWRCGVRTLGRQRQTQRVHLGSTACPVEHHHPCHHPRKESP